MTRARVRRRMLTLAACVVAALTFAGCSGPASNPTATPPLTMRSIGPSADPLQPGPLPAWASRLPAAKMVPLLGASEAQGLTSMPWRFVSLSEDGKNLSVIYAAGDKDCVTPVGFQVAEATTSVEVWAWSKTDQSRQACANMLLLSRGVVTLPTPLDSRTLYHAPVDRSWSSPNIFD